MKLPLSLTIPQPLFRQLFDHLFPGDNDEHGAIIAAGISETARGTRLLAREVFLARDMVEYVPGKRGYRALTAEFVAKVSGYCASENLCYLAVHCHRGSDSVAFSGQDLASHERGYPALLDITHGGPVGALVFAKNAVAGDVWTPEGRFTLSHATIVGPRIRRLYPERAMRPPKANLIDDRHSRLFGDLGQYILANMKVGIIGLGGGGSLINEWLARLGIGHIVAVDFDRVDITNLPRIVGATHWDALSFLSGSKHPFFRELGKRYARHKVGVAERVAKQARPKIRYDAIVGDIVNEDTARLLTDVDFLFLASDTTQSRLVFNALVNQYLIPGAQVGAKVMIDKNTGAVGDIHVAGRMVLPYPGGGCLDCHQLISPERLRQEALSEGERKAQRYVDDEEIKEPSVITLNVLSAAQVVNDLMMMFTGLYDDSASLNHLMNFTRERTLSNVEPTINEHCLDCGDGSRSRIARGDRFRLPCRESI